MKILVTGAAGFIGSNLVKAIYNQISDAIVIGIDNINDYYDVRLKEERLAQLEQYDGFRFVKGNIADRQLIDELDSTQLADCDAESKVALLRLSANLNKKDLN